MVKRNSDPKENLDLAKEHIKLAEDLVSEEGRKTSQKEKKFTNAAFTLEKAENEIEEIEDDEELDNLEVLGEEKEPVKEE